MGEAVTNYRQLRAWQKAMDLVEQIFKSCKKLPDEQRFGLISQMQRAAISIPSNIAEGNAKRLGKDYIRHLKMAAGSLAELETQIELCVRLKLLSRDDVRDTWKTSQDVARLLSRLISSLS